MLRNAFASTAWLILAASRLTNAACECGYATDSDPDAVFTELMENNFLHTKGDDLHDFGWIPQEFNVSAKDGRGPYGKQFVPENVQTNPLKKASKWSGESEHGGDAGLQLWVRGDHSNGFVSSGEVASEREDVVYGSFRVGMKMSSVNGTCGGFFYFRNDSMEIDMEFLSKQFEQGAGAVNLVMQSPLSAARGDASGTAGYKVQPLPFSPDDHFHEYRFDWTPGKVVFYVDGERKDEMTDNIPTESGHLLLNHWSNGNPLWSAGPPKEDTVMTISYMKSYFNSSSEERQKAYEDRCSKFDPKKVCTIPAQTKAPDGANAQTYFFSQDGSDKTPGQETFDHTNSASSLLGASTSVWTFVPLLVAIVSCVTSL